MTSTQRHYNKSFCWLIASLLLFALCYSQATAETAGTSLPLDWTYQGETTGEEVGLSVSAAGDVDGDGFADVIIGAPHADSALGKAGAAYVFLGPVTQPNPIPDVTLSGPRNGSLFGTSVSSIGDFDGDGFNDVAVGAPEHKPDDLLPQAGAAYIYRGSSAGTRTIPELSLIGETRESRLGASVAGAGDIDSDGYADVVIGAPYDSSVTPNGGQIRIIFGTSTDTLTGTLRVQTITGDQANAKFGAAVASAGDVNGDGYADVIVGAPYYEHNAADNGAAFLYFGSSSGLVEPPAWQAYGSQTLANEIHGVMFGAVVGTAGDVNGDGYDDWLVSAPGYDGAFVDEGRVEVFYGQSTDLYSATTWIKNGGVTGALFGSGASTAGDVNADTYADLIIGMPFYESSTSGSAQNVPEAALVYLGSPYGLRQSRAWKLICNQSSTDFGSAVSSAGDTDKDGYDDVLVGAPRYKREEQVRGQAFGYLGVEGNGAGFSVYLPMVMKQP